MFLFNGIIYILNSAEEVLVSRENSLKYICLRGILLWACLPGHMLQNNNLTIISTIPPKKIQRFSVLGCLRIDMWYHRKRSWRATIYIYSFSSFYFSLCFSSKYLLMHQLRRCSNGYINMEIMFGKFIKHKLCSSKYLLMNLAKTSLPIRFTILLQRYIIYV